MIRSENPLAADGGSMAEVILIALFLVVHLFAVSQLALLGEDVLYGDGASAKMAVSLRYPAMRVPATPSAASLAAEGRLCADFAQIYFPSQRPFAMGDAYAVATTPDPWSRESKYPPFVHFLCSLTLCRLEYGAASLVHLGLQLLLFLGSFVYAMRRLKLNRELFPALLLADFCLFLTPVGLSFLERGQFSLYVALCYLWLTLFIVEGRKRYIVLSALFGFMKWTAFPLVFVACAVYLLDARSWRELRRRLALPAIFGGTVLLLFGSFPREGMLFLKAALVQEASYSPMGITLVHLLPRYAVKALPLLLVALGCAHRLRRREGQWHLAAYFTGAGVLLVTYPTFAFDYSVPCLLAFIPCLLYGWKEAGVAKGAAAFAQASFVLFLVLASFSIELFGSEAAVVGYYLVTGVGLLVASFWPPATAGAEAASG